MEKGIKQDVTRLRMRCVFSSQQPGKINEVKGSVSAWLLRVAGKLVESLGGMNSAAHHMTE